MSNHLKSVTIGIRATFLVTKEAQHHHQLCYNSVGNQLSQLQHRHQQFEKLNGDSVRWAEYKNALIERFDTDFEDPLSELKNLKIFKPRSLSDTASLCKLQEATIDAHKARHSLVLPLPKPNTIGGSFGNRGVAKGLCFHCDQKFIPGKKFIPGHKRSGQAFALELIIDLDPQMEMCLMKGNGTIRVIGHFEKQKIHILIDLGSTHNILDVFMAKKLRCKIHEIDPFQVSVADGNKITNNNMCKKLCCMLNGEKFCTDVMLLGGCEMVLEFSSKQLSSMSLFVPTEVSEKEALVEFLKEFEDVFALHAAMPPQRQHDHIIPLKEGIGIGAVLQQEGNLAAYLNKTLAPKHHSLSAYEKELLAVIMALDKWRGYLLDRHFQIKIDHFSLKYFLDQRITTPFQSKQFDYEIMYKRGKENQVADALSRSVHGGELSTMVVSTIFT
nr:TMV resistance protein N [Tanacetum cinerariifolium]